VKIEKLRNNLWVPSNDAQIASWRDKGYPHMQDKCLNQFIEWCETQQKRFKTILDVGAWCGTWSLGMQRYAKRIKCFEPNKTHFECLTRNLSVYNNISFYNQALGNKNGFVTLTKESATQNTRVLEVEGETPIAKIDSLDVGDVEMIKIDVEGLEMEVLKGAEHTLSKVSYIMIELNNNSKRYGSSNIEIENYLKNLGFKILIKTWPDIVWFKA